MPRQGLQISGLMQSTVSSPQCVTVCIAPYTYSITSAGTFNVHIGGREVLQLERSLYLGHGVAPLTLSFRALHPTHTMGIEACGEREWPLPGSHVTVTGALCPEDKPSSGGPRLKHLFCVESIVCGRGGTEAEDAGPRGLLAHAHHPPPKPSPPPPTSFFLPPFLP